MTTCPVNVDPEGGTFPLDLLLDGITGNVTRLEATLSWQAQTPASEELEAYVMLSACGRTARRSPPGPARPCPSGRPGGA